MCEQAAHDLADRMRRNEAFRERLLVLRDPGERLVLAQSEGYLVTAEELATRLDGETQGSAQAAAGGALADEQLDGVDGGLDFGPVPHGLAPNGSVPI